MDKPTTLSVKDWIVRNMSVEMNVPERVIQSIVSHQFSRARDAMETGYSVQFSGFGKYMFNMHRAHKKLAKFNSLEKNMQGVIDNPNTTPQHRTLTQYKIGVLRGDIKLLERKLKITHEDKSGTDLGRVAE